MPVAAVSLGLAFPSHAPRIPVPRSPPPRCRASRLTGNVLQCVGKVARVRGEPSGSWSPSRFHSLGTSCARKGTLSDKKRGMLFNTPRVSHFARDGQKQDEVFQRGELGTFREEPRRCARGGRLSRAPPGVGAVPCLPPRERKRAVLFLPDFHFCKEFGSFGKGRGGKNPACPVCLARNRLLTLRRGGWRAAQRLPRAPQRREAGSLRRVPGGKCKNLPVLDALKEKGEAVVCYWPVAQAQLRGISLREAPRTLSPVRQCRKHGLRWQRWWKRGSEEKLGHSPGSCRGRGEGAGSLPGAGGWRCPRGGRRCRRARVVLA